MTTILHEQRWHHDVKFPKAVHLKANVQEYGDVPPGPWDDEPDKVQWVDGDTDLDCLAVRGPHGAWCGYVGVPKGHPMYGMHLNDAGEALDVHDGITYAALCQEDVEEGHGICHVPLEGRPADVWWLGFACMSMFDIRPADLPLERAINIPGWPESTYKPLAYIQDECANLAAQLKVLW
jgi:hypothetical protein